MGPALSRNQRTPAPDMHLFGTAPDTAQHIKRVRVESPALAHAMHGDATPSRPREVLVCNKATLSSHSWLKALATITERGLPLQAALRAFDEKSSSRSPDVRCTCLQLCLRRLPSGLSGKSSYPFYADLLVDVHLLLIAGRLIDASGLGNLNPEALKPQTPQDLALEVRAPAGRSAPPRCRSGPPRRGYFCRWPEPHAAATLACPSARPARTSAAARGWFQKRVT